MSVIEGIGDEVTIFVTVLVLVLGMVLAVLSSRDSRRRRNIVPPITQTQQHQTREGTNNLYPNLPVPPQGSPTAPTQGAPPTPTAPKQGAPSTPTQWVPPVPTAPTQEASSTPTAPVYRSTTLPYPPETELHHRHFQTNHDTTPGNSNDTIPQHDNWAESGNDGNIPESGNDGRIRIKLKYLDDREQVVMANPAEEIGQFKRAHFLHELTTGNLNIRLIFNGQELRQENQTLQSYNVNDNSVIHCLVSTVNQQGASLRRQAELEQVGDMDMSNMMFPLFGLILALIWYCRLTYRNFFNAMSTLALIGVTVLFLFSVIITFRNQHTDNVQQRQQHAHVQ